MATTAGLFAILLFTSFVKASTVIEVVRQALGLTSGVLAVPVAGLAVAVALVTCAPEIGAAGGAGAVLRSEDTAALQETFRPFMERHTPAESVRRFTAAARPVASADAAGVTGSARPPADAPVRFDVLLLAFLVSELSSAFSVALVVIVPFVVLDLVVVNVLAALDVTQVSADVVSFPLKVALFFGVDGWTLLTEKLLGAYA